MLWRSLDHYLKLSLCRGHSGMRGGTGASLVMVIALIAGVVATRPAWPDDGSVPSEEARNLAIFDAAWKMVDRHYYDREARRKDWIAIGAMARPLAARATDDADLYLNILWPTLEQLGDSHFAAVPPEPKRRDGGASSMVKQEPIMGSDSVSPPNSGLGFVYQLTRQGGRVVEVSRNSPLDQAGVGPGDAIKEMIIGPPAAGGARFEGVFERADGTTAKVAYRWVEQVEPGVASLRLPSGRLLLRFDHFDVESVDWLLQQLRSAPPQGVVLDLRRNAGGNVSEKRKMLGAVLGPGLPVGVRLDGGRAVEKSAGRMIYTGPLAILVGPNSASAAEASADILHHYDRAVLVGERTAGSVLISRNFYLPGGGKIQVPVASFETLDGERLEGRGVVPDCDVRQTLAAIRAGRDLVVEAAERALGARASMTAGAGRSWSSACYST